MTDLKSMNGEGRQKNGLGGSAMKESRPTDWPINQKRRGASCKQLVYE